MKIEHIKQDYKSQLKRPSKSYKGRTDDFYSYKSSCLTTYYGRVNVDENERFFISPFITSYFLTKLNFLYMETLKKETAKAVAVKNETAIELTTWKKIYGRVWQKAARKAAIEFIDAVNEETGTSVEVSSSLISALAETCTASNKSKQLEKLLACFKQNELSHTDNGALVNYEIAVKDDQKKQNKTDKALKTLAESLGLSVEELQAKLAK